MEELLIRNKFNIPVEQATVAADWKSQGYSCSVFVDPPGREWNHFVHSCDELVTVTQGRLAMTIDNQQFIAEVGDEVFIPRGIVHSVKNIHHTTTYWLYGYSSNIS